MLFRQTHRAASLLLIVAAAFAGSDAHAQQAPPAVAVEPPAAAAQAPPAGPAATSDPDPPSSAAAQPAAPGQAPAAPGSASSLSPAAPSSPSEAAPSEKPPNDELEREIAQQLSQLPPPQAPPPASDAGAQETTSPASAGTATASGLSNTFNPAISATAVMFAGGTTRPAATGALQDFGELRSGVALQEAELRFSAIVDPYLRADVMLAGNTDGVAFEEAYLSTLSLPHVTIRAGQFPAALGRHNPLHTHAFPFLTAPLPWRVLLGPEGLRDPGISADVLLPLPFYAEVNAQVFRGEWRPFEGSLPGVASANGTAIDLRHDQDLAYLGHLKLLFDLSDPTTLELGGTYLAGRNGFGGLTQLAAGDLTVKWRPIEAERYTGLEWTTEYLFSDRQGTALDRRQGGGYTALRYQFAQRFWVQAREAMLGLPAGASGRSTRTEALLALVPSEFTALRLQYAFEPAHAQSRPVHEVFLQAIVSIGVHPAHAY